MTPTDITVTGEDFVSVNEVAGVPIGTALELQTKCASVVIVQRKDGKPSATDNNGRVMKSVKNASSIYQIGAGSEEVWLRLNTDNFESEGKVGVYPAVDDINYVARLDGVNQYWQLSEANLVLPGESTLLGFIADSSITSGQYDRFIASENFNFTVDTGASGNKFRTIGCTATLDGVEIVNETTPIPTDSLPHRLVVFPNNGGNIEAIGNLLSVSGRSISAAVFDFKIKNSSGDIINEIPLTNREQGATQLPTVGNVSATMVNYTEDVWEQI